MHLELLKTSHMKENKFLTYYRIGKSEGCEVPVPTDYRYGSLFYFYGKEKI